MHTGVILAGGRSTRFGDEDKAIADLAGTPMIRRVADRIVPAIDDLVVNCRDEQLPGITKVLDSYDYEVTVAVDEQPGCGPIAGIMTGLRAVSAEYAFVVACDMPHVDPELVSHLFDRAAGHDAAVPRLDDCWFQTTHAVYRTDPMADACEEALARGERKIIEPLFELDYVVVEESEVREYSSPEVFENVNTREDLEAAAQKL